MEKIKEFAKKHKAGIYAGIFAAGCITGIGAAVFFMKQPARCQDVAAFRIGWNSNIGDVIVKLVDKDHGDLGNWHFSQEDAIEIAEDLKTAVEKARNNSN